MGALHTFSTETCIKDSSLCHELFYFTVSRTIDTGKFRRACSLLSESHPGFVENGASNPDNGASVFAPSWAPDQFQQYDIFGNSQASIAWCGFLEAPETRLEHRWILAVRFDFAGQGSIFSILSNLQELYQSCLQSGEELPPKAASSCSFSRHRHSEKKTKAHLPLTSLALNFESNAGGYNKSKTYDVILRSWCLQLANLESDLDGTIDVWTPINSDAQEDSAASSFEHRGFSAQTLKYPIEQAEASRNHHLQRKLQTHAANPGRNLLLSNCPRHRKTVGVFPQLSLLQNLISFPYDTALEYASSGDKIEFRLHWNPSRHDSGKIRAAAKNLWTHLQQALEHSMDVESQITTAKPRASASTQHLIANDYSTNNGAKVHGTKLDKDVLSNSNLKKSTSTTDKSGFTSQDIDEVLHFNSRKVPTVNQSIPTLFSKAVQKTPHKSAIESWDGTLSYLELETFSDRLAEHIRSSMNCSAEPIVTVFNKSAWAIVTILAILKSGNHYVPADPSHPLSRIKCIISLTNATKVMSSEHISGVSNMDGLEHLVITENFVRTLTSSSTTQRDSSKPTERCVVLFTSGSTGNPKGVPLRHRAICTSLVDHGSAIGVNSASRVLSFASFAFDAHLWDTWTCLFYGGTVCIPNNEERTSDLQGFLLRNKITDALLTPSLCGLITPSSLPFFKCLIVGGESISSGDMKALTKFETVKVINAYGPTECSVISSLNANLQTNDVQNIGKPIGGSCFVVDKNDVNTLLPVGCEGEIVVSGDHLADGYLDDEEKTAEVFVVPRWPEWAPKARVYKTGDLGTLGKDGNLRISGRKDGLIKFHGIRIEVGEVEYHIAQLELHGAGPVVDLVRLESGRQALVCFFVPKGFGKSPYCVKLEQNEELDSLATTIKKQLQESLPTNWIPTNFMFVTKIPLNTSDKIDRGKLREMFVQRNSGVGTTPVAKKPTVSALRGTKAGDDVKQVWKQVLHLKSSVLRPYSDFFELGASSVDAIKAIRDLRNLGYHISTTDLLKHSRLEDLAQLCGNSSAPGEETQTTKLYEYDPKPFELLRDISLP